MLNSKGRLAAVFIHSHWVLLFGCTELVPNADCVIVIAVRTSTPALDPDWSLTFNDYLLAEIVLSLVVLKVAIGRLGQQFSCCVNRHRHRRSSARAQRRASLSLYLSRQDDRCITRTRTVVVD